LLIYNLHSRVDSLPKAKKRYKRGGFAVKLPHGLGPGQLTRKTLPPRTSRRR
jgi:hypothetical protein